MDSLPVTFEFDDMRLIGCVHVSHLPTYQQLKEKMDNVTG
jgi:hypothetical protein